MESFVKSAAAEAAAFTAALMRAPGGAGVGSGAGNPLGLGAGGPNGGGVFQRSDMTQHAEQYRHNSGWVAASIKPIASRIARQAVRVARVMRKSAAKMPGGVVRKSRKPWEPKATEDRSREQWFRSTLPGHYKELAPEAELIESHPFLDAINDPNEIMVRWSLFFVTVASLLLTGKAYWWVTEREAKIGADGKPIIDGAPPVEIWPVPSSWVKPIHTAEKLFSHYEITAEGSSKAERVEAYEIIYFSLPDPQNPLGAKSVLQDVGRAVVTDEAISEAQRRSFANGIFPGFAVVVGRMPEASGVPGTGDRPALNKEQRAQIITAFKQAYSGPYKNNEPVILDRVIEDIRRISNTNAEMDYMNSGTYTKDRITQGFGVNPISMGQVEGANRASSATADDHLCQNTVNPIIELMSQTATKWIQTFDEPGQRTYLYIEEARAVDPDSERADWEALFDRGACSVDEFRAGIRSLPPVVNGSKRYIASGVMEIDGRLASETSVAEPPVMLGEPPVAPVAPPVNQAPKPNAPVEPARTSEPSSVKNALRVIELLRDMAAKRFTPEQAQAVLFSILFNVPGRKLETALASCVVGGVLVAPTANAITAIARSFTEPDECDARTEIAVEDVRQRAPFDCGSAAGYAVALAQGCEPGSYSDFMVALDTEEEVGTTAEDLFAYFAHKGCDPRQGSHRSFEYLRNEIRRGRLCLCPVQYFGDGDAGGGEGGAGYDSGHWITVCGFTATGVLYQCPIDGPGEIPCNEFVGNWYDRGNDGKPFLRYAISVGTKPKPIIDPPTN